MLGSANAPYSLPVLEAASPRSRQSWFLRRAQRKPLLQASLPGLWMFVFMSA